MRRVLFWMHLGAGVLVGILILFFSITGSLLAYQRPIQHASTMQVLRRVPFAELSRGQQWRSWVRFIHTGEAGGWWGQSAAMVTTLGAIMLSITGFLLFLARLRRLRG